MSETRRSFLSLSLGSMAALGTGLVGFGLMRACAPAAGVMPEEFDFSDLAPGDIAKVKIVGRPGAIYHDPETGLHAYFQVCSRFGCVLAMSDEDGVPVWRCYCDNAIFSLTGEPLKGPVIHPLRRLPVTIEGKTLSVAPAAGMLERIAT